MGHATRLGLAGLLSLAVIFVMPTVSNAQVSTEDCLECHQDSGGDPVEVTPEHLAASVHTDFDCVDCHADIEELPHEDELASANCGLCHDDVTETYTAHASAVVGVDPDVPSCADCHGSHDIRPVADRESLVNSINLPHTCARCHEDDLFTSEQGIRFQHPVEVYETSVHGRANAGGTHSAATCNDCHATDGSAHTILPAGDVRSPINHFNISSTCAKCHKGITQDYNEGIHGILTARGNVASPVCTTCHGEHNILETDDPRSPVNVSRLAEATCEPCHESAWLNERYQLPTGKIRGYEDSYHGLKSKSGDRTVANCMSCHGAHRILPSSDPSSTIHPDNLQKTCGHCHATITAEIAQTPIHQVATDATTGIAGVVRRIYIALIFFVIGGMALHWVIDWLRKVKVVLLEKEQTRRMDADEVIQHAILALSFTVLVLSGFSLRFYDAWWSKWIFGHEGGYQLRGNVHRVAGVVLLAGSLWHTLYLFTRRGRVFLRDMAPNYNDMRQFIQMSAYNLGLSQEHPHFRRFSYVEKAEYWALVWGTAVMGITGLLLWYENSAIRFVSRELLDVMLVIHYYEAWLAFLAIVVWHMYATIFNPTIYPMNPSWITGTMPVEQFKAEHPAARAAGNRDKMDVLDASKTD